MSTKRLTVLAAVLVSAFFSWYAVGQKAPAPAQSSSANQEMTTKDSDKIGLPIPEKIKVKVANGTAVVSWEKSLNQRIVSYQVFRKTDQGRFVPVKAVPGPPFIDDDLLPGTTEYTVEAIDYRGNRSEMSAPGKVVQERK
jgi:hypothetical protein